MKLKLDDIKVKSFVTKDLGEVKGGWAPPTEAYNCTFPEVCGIPTEGGLGCNPSLNCPSDWGGCGPTGLC